MPDNAFLGLEAQGVEFQKQLLWGLRVVLQEGSTHPLQWILIKTNPLCEWNQGSNSDPASSQSTPNKGLKNPTYNYPKA